MCGAQQPNHGWRAAAVGSILCVLRWEFSLFCVLEYSRGDRVSHCHTHTVTHMERNPGRQDFTTHTRTHTPHTVTHAHTCTLSHAHTHTHSHTQGQVHAHKHIQMHANTRTQNTHMLPTLPVDKARHARQLVGHW